ncbi:MAG: aconitase/3-isopropylmalate dehydratase large subunit family protein [Dehalobacterium sp.]
MAMTVTEKILAQASGKGFVQPGDIVTARIDRAMVHDNNAPLVMKAFNRLTKKEVWDPERIVFVIDHHSPSTSVKAAAHQQNIREFVKDKKIRHFFDCGAGISHIVMLEGGLAGPGQVIVGSDSHTTGQGALGSFATGIGATEMAGVLATGTTWFRVPQSILITITGTLPPGVDARDVISQVLNDLGPSGANYFAVEFAGPVIGGFELSEKATLCVMSMEMGAKNAIIVPPDGPDVVKSDLDAVYHTRLTYDVSHLEPLVSCPFLPTNVKTVREVEKEKICIQQASITSCAGASLRDLATAAGILAGHRVHEGVRLIVIPATRKIYDQAVTKGYLKTIFDAGGIINSPGCGNCGAHDVGILAPGEVGLSSSTRNMPGRMGPGGEVYLSSAGTVAASALRGYICDPREYIKCVK